MKKQIRDLLHAAGAHDNFNSADWFCLSPIVIEKFAELLVKECAYLVNHQQRTTGYTTHAQMLCKEFGIEYKDEDYYG